MIIVLLGASGSGKSTIESELRLYNFKKIISWTTRSRRKYELDGLDYHFVNQETFKNLQDKGLFAEYDEYSQHRNYGTLKSDYEGEEDKVVVLTPNGLRNLKKNCPDANIYSILIKASLGARVKRYIDRCGVYDFNYDDMNEINARVNRDFGMFLKVEDEVDLVVENNETEDIEKILNKILEIREENKWNN